MLAVSTEQMSGRFVYQLRLPKWIGDKQLEEKYARLIHAIAEHKSKARYSVVLHGSTLWGDRTNLRDGSPVSDVDVLVVGDAGSDLSKAAVALRSIANQFGSPPTPLFKLSPKFRTRKEICTAALSANELAALMHGSVLSGCSQFEIPCPDKQWFSSQARLAVATRLVYVAEQTQRIAGCEHREVLTRYLAARIVLDIATVGLLVKGITGLSYASRIETFLSEFAVDHRMRLPETRAMLMKALQTKRDPEGSPCTSISVAATSLLRYTRALGLTATIRSSPRHFWLTCRPLDVRDRLLWRASEN